MDDLTEYKSSTATKMTEMVIAVVVLSVVMVVGAGAFYLMVSTA